MKSYSLENSLERIDFPGRPIFIQLPPGEGSGEGEDGGDGESDSEAAASEDGGSGEVRVIDRFRGGGDICSKCISVRMGALCSKCRLITYYNII